MKTNIKKIFLLPALVAGLSLILDCPLIMAQTLTNLHNFYGNPEGNSPGELLLSGNTLYGTTFAGGTSEYGTVFQVNANGTSFTNLYSFPPVIGPFQINNDGVYPFAGLILVSNRLYGTAEYGGSNHNGTIFAINTDGTGFTVLHTFSAHVSATNSDGALPRSRLILSGNTLYGTAEIGGSANRGTVFAVNTDGTGFTNLYSFTATSGSFYTNSDGAHPLAGLILSGNTLYGTASDAGSSGYGTVFKLTTNGTGFTTLHTFTGDDGAMPFSALLLLGDALYGTTTGSYGSKPSTVFAVSTNGTGYTNLHTFTGVDGSASRSGLISSGNILYGTTIGGSGYTYSGTVFAVNTDGTGFTNLYVFTALNSGTNTDGAAPQSGLLLKGNTLYGTASGGGAFGNGTVFSLTLPLPYLPLSITTISNAPVVFWPASGSNYVLQTTTNLDSGIWTTASNGVPVIGLQITNLLNPSNAYFRLVQP